MRAGRRSGGVAGERAKHRIAMRCSTGDAARVCCRRQNVAATATANGKGELVVGLGGVEGADEGGDGGEVLRVR